jgi:ribosomal protein L11 methyltransferase
MSATSKPSDFACVEIATSRARAERVAAEVFAAGASGLEEREEGDGIRLLVYAPAAQVEAVRSAAREADADAAIAPAAVVVARDWPETWKEGLAPIEISPRLVVRPPFAAHALADGQCEVVIEPRQAFGTGAHGSTALALALLDARLAARRAARILDVGSGSGVLAIAALRLGAGRALACDLDPIAARETRENAARNGVGARLASFAGSLDALGARAGVFDVVIANMISSELHPILAALAARVSPDGVAIFSGLLASERDAITNALAAHDLHILDTRQQHDATLPRSEPQASGEAHKARARTSNQHPDPIVPRSEPQASGEPHELWLALMASH